MPWYGFIACERCQTGVKGDVKPEYIEVVRYIAKGELND